MIGARLRFNAVVVVDLSCKKLGGYPHPVASLLESQMCSQFSGILAVSTFKPIATRRTMEAVLTEPGRRLGWM